MASIIWAIIGVLLMGAEIFIPGFVIFFFGLGAIATAILSLLPVIGGSFLLQALLWVAASLGTIGLLRKKLPKIFKPKLLSKKADEYIGRKAVVIERVSPEKPGRIKIEGTTWKAISDTETIEKGEEVEILHKENLTFTVTKSILGLPE